MTGSIAANVRRRPQLARLLLLLGGILFALLLGEIALRIYGFTYFNASIVDEEVGYALRPGAEGWWRREGLTYVKINSHGFHDREHTIAKPPSTIRIAVIGDSFTEAFQVPLEKAFYSVLESKLQGCAPAAGSRVEVLSFGVSGFSTARELIFLRSRVWQFSPDVVVLLVTTGNDIRDNSRALNEYASHSVPYYYYRDGKLVLDNSQLLARSRTLTFRLQRSFIGSSFNWIRNHSRVLGLIYAAREAYQSDGTASVQPSDNRKDSGGLVESGLTNEVYREPVKAVWQEAWRVTEGLIVQMRDEVRAKGVDFLVVTGSMGIQVNPDENVRLKFMKSLGIRDLFYPDQRIAALGQREKIDVLTLAPAHAEYAIRNRAFLHGAGDNRGQGHWNELGHRLSGELIAEKLCRTINGKK